MGKRKGVPYAQFKRYGFGTDFTPVKLETDEQWREFRKSGMGGSDIAPIMGISPYRTALDVWLEKTGRQEPEDISDVEAVYWGNANEAAIARRYAEDHHECRVRRVNATLVGDRDWKRANLDRMVIEPDGGPSVLEVKTASAYKAGDWVDGVPAYYLTQVMWYLAVTGWDMAHVAVLIGGNDYREYDVERDEEDVRAVTEAATEFWEGFVLTNTMPEVVGADVQALAGVLPQASDELSVPEDVAGADRLIGEYLDAKARKAEAEEEMRDAQAKLCKVIGGGRGIETDVARVTWTRSETSRFDSKRFQEEHPDVYEQYKKTGITSRFSVKEQ